jgi:hypothetical protein
MNNKKPSRFKKIWCCNCNKEVWTIAAKGKKIYPHIPKLKDNHYWQCKHCSGYVGCHPDDRYHRPLGSIPTPRLKKARNEIHKILDPLWQSYKKKNKKRTELYREISTYLGYEFHTAEIRDIEEAKKIFRFIRDQLVPKYQLK